MPLLLLVEDTPADLRKAWDIAQSAGFTECEVSTYASNALMYLEKAFEGKAPLPDAMLIDLNLGTESGFELLRFWHGNSKLKRIPIVVWSVMDGSEREICRLFGVYRFVSKHDSPAVLREALVSIISTAGSSASS